MELTFGSETGSCSDDSLTSPAGGGPPRTRSVNVGVAGETPKEVWELSPRDTSLTVELCELRTKLLLERANLRLLRLAARACLQ